MIVDIESGHLRIQEEMATRLQDYMTRRLTERRRVLHHAQQISNSMHTFTQSNT